MNSTFAALASILGVSAALFACGGGSDSSQTGDDQNVTSGAKMCGGIAGLSCPTGYTCKLASKNPDASGTCQKQGSCLKAVCSDEENCDNTGGKWRDDDVNPATGLYCDCAAGTTWTAGKGCVADAPVPTCGTLMCKAGTHCCSGPATPPGAKPFAATCQPNGSFCPL